MFNLFVYFILLSIFLCTHIHTHSIILVFLSLIRAARSKSGAFGKLVKKFSSKGKGDKPSSSPQSKHLTSSNSNLESFLKRVHRSHSMELLHLNGGTPILGGDGRKVATPTPSPGVTPKMGKGFFRTRRNSETDLENCKLIIIVHVHVAVHFLKSITCFVHTYMCIMWMLSQL